jgi:hypothetical protein
MALPEWLRVSVDAVSKARRLRRSGRQDLIDAVERGALSLDAAVEQIEGKPRPSGPSAGDDRLAALADRVRTLARESDPAWCAPGWPRSPTRSIACGAGVETVFLQGARFLEPYEQQRQQPRDGADREADAERARDRPGGYAPLGNLAGSDFPIQTAHASASDL